MRPIWPVARRERGSVSAAILDRPSNEAPGQFQRNPSGGSSFSLRRRCSLLTDPRGVCSSLAPSAVTFNYRYMRCAQFSLWQGARRAHTPQWVCNRRATQPQAKFGATLRAAVLFRPDFVARSLQIHSGICSSLAPCLAEKSLAAHVSIIKCHSTRT